MEMTKEQSAIILAKRERYLANKRASNKRYKDKDVIAYNKTQAEYMKKYYYKNKEIVEKANEIAGILPIVKTTIYKLPQDTDNTEIIPDTPSIPSFITNNTPKGVNNALNYVKIITKVHHNYTENHLDIDIITRLFNGNYTKKDETYIVKNINYITKKNIDEFIIYLKQTYINSNSLKNNLMPYIILSSYINKYKDAYQKLSSLNKQCIANYNNIRDKNIIIDNNKIINYNPIAIDKMLADNTNFNNSKSKVIYGLYSLITTRRLEMASVILTDNTNIAELNDTNYLIIDKDGYTLVFNKYKTFKSFGKQVVPIPISLKILIDKYCLDFDIIIGSPLFPTNADKNIPVSNSSFGKTLCKVFTTIYNTPLSLNYLRMSCATYNHSLNLSLEENKRFANAMSHNLETELQYVKKNC